jgi:hypothetical protein
MVQPTKTKDFKPNDSLDALLDELKILLLPIQKTIQKDYTKPKWPVGLIVGNPRSGTTLFLQWLASLGTFSYPSNILTRFSYAPYIGGLVQNLLFDATYDFHGEFADIQSGVNYKSNLGKSKGALATNEFQHYFRNFLPSFVPRHLEIEELSVIDYSGLRSSLASIEAALRRPFITKGVLLQYNLDAFTEEIPELFIFYIKRDPLFNMQSLLLARDKYYGDRNIWWSVQPKEYGQLIKTDIYHQVAGQVFFTDQAIQKQLTKKSSEQVLTVEYEEFCNNPESYYQAICDRYKYLNYTIDCDYNGPKSFESQNKHKISKNDLTLLESAYADYCSGDYAL